jgi:hypothetical protein
MMPIALVSHAPYYAIWVFALAYKEFFRRSQAFDLCSERRFEWQQFRVFRVHSCVCTTRI